MNVCARFGSLFLISTLLVACAGQSHTVIAASATMIGIEVGQNPANQSPTAKVGYNRAELAIVPTNRATGDDPGDFLNGATDVADVIMELKYKGLFGGDDSGIYQRLAVGPNAVKTMGAAFMFAREPGNELDAGQAAAISAAMAGIAEVDTSPLEGDLSRAFTGGDQAAFDAVADELGYETFQGFLAVPAKSDARLLQMQTALMDAGLIN
jgi:hypothetical protein